MSGKVGVPVLVPTPDVYSNGVGRVTTVPFGSVGEKVTVALPLNIPDVGEYE
jgi:hypothetical protein